MEVEPNYADRPIESPHEDLFGVDAFAQALARGIRGMKAPHGIVIALNGAWGSGKSSAINLLRHHLAEDVQKGTLEITSFNPWWFRGEEALVLAFFRELYAATKPTLGEKAQKLVPKLGARLLKAGGLVAPIADAFGASGAGSIAAGAMNWLGGMIEDGESVETLQDELAKALSEQSKRFVVLVDDIDRLTPDEALAMFRLVKSVGRLPNVLYVVAFDRILAEKVVAERFPSEGPHYLEKIIQVSFDVPTPDAATLRLNLIQSIFEISGTPPESLLVHTMNLFHEVVAPEIATPRDAVRYLNTISLTWPAVAGEVDLGDFLALEAYRLFRPAIYRAIRANQSLVCGMASIGLHQVSITHDQLDAQLLHGISDVTRFRRGLMRLFPRLASIWGNTFHSSDRTWARQRRACVERYFPAYFQLSLTDEIVSRLEIDELIAHSDSPGWIGEALKIAAKTPRRTGGTRAAVLLDALTTHAPDVPLAHVLSLLTGVFAVADEIDLATDEAGAFAIGNNSLRIHWLMRALLAERTDIGKRSHIIKAAAKDAPLDWLVDLATSCRNDHHPREGRTLPDETDRLVTADTAVHLAGDALRAIRRAARDGTLIEHRHLAWLLFRWREFAGDGDKAVKRWTSARLREDASVVRLADALTSHSWSQGMDFGGLGDLVAKRSVHVQINGLDQVLDTGRLHHRAASLAAKYEKGSSEQTILERFLAGWKAAQRDKRGS